MYNKDDANFINTRTWVLLNHDRDGDFHRKQFVEQFNGKFVRTNQGFFWDQTPVDPPKKKTLYVVVDPEGNEFVPKNFQGFCRENNLNKTALYAVANGLRNHHKNYNYHQNSRDFIYYFVITGGFFILIQSKYPYCFN